VSAPLKSQQPKRDTRAEIAREAKVPERDRIEQWRPAAATSDVRTK
jgi:hypothetical protein